MFFFDADLIQTKINANQGAIALIDDYSAWVIDTSVEQVLPPYKQNLYPGCFNGLQLAGFRSTQAKRHWYILCRRQGRKRNPQVSRCTLWQGNRKNVCKLLGVHLDQELTCTAYAREAGIKGIKAALALKRLRMWTFTLMPDEWPNEWLDSR